MIMEWNGILFYFLLVVEVECWVYAVDSLKSFHYYG